MKSLEIMIRLLRDTKEIVQIDSFYIEKKIYRLISIKMRFLLYFLMLFIVERISKITLLPDRPWASMGETPDRDVWAYRNFLSCKEPLCELRTGDLAKRRQQCLDIILSQRQTRLLEGNFRGDSNHGEYKERLKGSWQQLIVLLVFFMGGGKKSCLKGQRFVCQERELIEIIKRLEKKRFSKKFSKKAFLT